MHDVAVVGVAVLRISPLLNTRRIRMGIGWTSPTADRAQIPQIWAATGRRVGASPLAGRRLAAASAWRIDPGFTSACGLVRGGWQEFPVAGWPGSRWRPACPAALTASRSGSEDGAEHARGRHIRRAWPVAAAELPGDPA
jgi:hypothetical protein